mmetsp:Transcript_20452/g.29587  ORF Transcript_20452/g.29587 Transcript_20452/m.29587 type:complete len:103 (-) Transcript_20452:112-420(-)
MGECDGGVFPGLVVFLNANSDHVTNQTMTLINGGFVGASMALMITVGLVRWRAERNLSGTLHFGISICIIELVVDDEDYRKKMEDLFQEAPRAGVRICMNWL